MAACHSSKKDTVELHTHLHTHVNIHIHAFRIAFPNANSTHICVMPPMHYTQIQPHLQPPVTEQRLHDARLSCDSEHQTRLHANTEPDEITVCTTEARARLPSPKSCINNSVIGHRSAASCCNPRSTISLRCFVHACRPNPWTAATCNFLIVLR